MSISPVSSTASLSAIVESYRDRIRRETGRTPDYPSALRDLDSLRSDGDDIEAEAFPVRRDLLPLRLYLAEQGYTDLAIETVLRDVSRTGSVWCSAAIDEEDRDAAERLVPGRNAWQWGPEADEVTWTATGDCAEPECGCNVCAEDRLVLAAWQHHESLVDPSEGC